MAHSHAAHAQHHDDHGDDDPRSARLAIVIAVLLGLAAIAGAYAAYRNELRDHESTVKFNEGIQHVDQASQKYTEGNQVLNADQQLFLEYAKAAKNNDTDIAAYLHDDLMSPTLRAGVDWWQDDPKATSPFVDQDPKYKVAQFGEGQELDKQAGEAFKDAKHEQNKADRFTLIEVILATALFLYGVAGVSRNYRIKVGATAVGAVIFVISIGLLITA